MIVHFLKATYCLGDVSRHGWLLGDDECFTHFILMRYNHSPLWPDPDHKAMNVGNCPKKRRMSTGQNSRRRKKKMGRVQIKPVSIVIHTNGLA
jgi:hypothetical protein